MFDKKKSNYSFGSQGIKIGAIVLIIICLYFLNLEPASRGVKNFFYSISYPIQKWFWDKGIQISDFAGSIFEGSDLKEENKKLKLENQELVNKTIEIEKLEEENKALRIVLGLGLEKEFELKISQAIGKDMSNDFLIINKGAKHGIEFGLPVITEQKILIGKVNQVYESISKVQLLTSKSISFDVKILGKEAYGLARGAGNFKLSIELIPREKTIQITDKIITSALGGNFPAGFLVGEVKNVKKSDIAAFQEVEAIPAFELGELNNLFIITDF